MPNPSAFNRRRFLAASAGIAGGLAAVPLLSACGSSSSSSGGVTTAKGLSAILPDYVPLTGGPKPDIPVVNGIHGATTDPGFLVYPANPIETVAAPPGAGGSYSAIIPLWGSIPPAGNAYDQALNKALGANLTVSPANGASYGTTLPTLVAGDKLPDWINIPMWNNSTANTGQLAAERFADLTPYLSGANVRKYPNLAAIPTSGWQSAAWQDKLYGFPCWTSGNSMSNILFYRSDVFAAKGIKPGEVTTADQLYALGAELTSAGAGVYAFDLMLGAIQQIFHATPSAANNPPAYIIRNGKVLSGCEAPEFEEALAFAYKIAKSGFMHPDALAGDTKNGKQRFWSGKSLLQSDGGGAWNVQDANSGLAANPSYVRGALGLFSADGSTPTIELGASSRMTSYLNKNLAKGQIEEILRIANYLAAPFGSAEFTLTTFGVEGVHYTMTANGPTYTTQGQREASYAIYQQLATPQTWVSNLGYPDMTKASCAYFTNAVKYAAKPAFWNMNITLPPQFTATSGMAQVVDTVNQVAYGTKTVADFKRALASWKSTGGQRMLDWLTSEVYAKYGDGS